MYDYVDEAIWNLPKNLFTFDALELRRIRINAIVKPYAAIKPNTGDTTINTKVFSTPSCTIAPIPPAINAEPMSPPIKAYYLMMEVQNTM